MQLELLVPAFSATVLRPWEYERFRRLGLALDHSEIAKPRKDSEDLARILEAIERLISRSFDKIRARQLQQQGPQIENTLRRRQEGLKRHRETTRSIDSGKQS